MTNVQRMSRRWCRNYLCVVIAVCLLAGLGCAAFEASEVRILYKGWIDNECRISLDRYAQVNAIRAGPDQNYASLTMNVSDGDAVLLSRCVGVRGCKGARSFADLRCLEYSDLEGRRDATRTRIWIVDKNKGSVIATLDRSSLDFTGVDDKPPSWAVPGEGFLLDSSPPGGT